MVQIAVDHKNKKRKPYSILVDDFVVDEWKIEKDPIMETLDSPAEAWLGNIPHGSFQFRLQK
jgi:peroxiredoxin